MSRREQLRRIQELFDKYGKKLSLAFLKAIQNIRDSFTLQEIVSRLEAHDFNGAAAVVSRNMEAATIPFIQTFHDTFVAGGFFGAETLLSNTKVALRFNVTNPKTGEFLNRYSMDLIRGITNDVKQTVNAVTHRGLMAGENPLTIAREIRDTIGLTPLQEQAVQNYRTALENQSKAALDRALRDKRFDSTVQSAIDGEKALTSEKVDRMVSRYRDRYLKYRSETIARTEATRAVSAGQKSLYQQAVDNGQILETQVRRYWVTAQDEKVREAHAVMPDINSDGVGLNEPFIDGDGNRLLFPSDPSAPPETSLNCRCSILTEVTVSPQNSYSQQ